ncbi:MAG: hypothetical protein SOY07_02505, partial [Bacteroidales bacterium]|nr:hypothetical protein [Bacteroidales bacterium]
MKKFDNFVSQQTGATIQLASFTPDEGGVGEFHAMIHIEPRGELFPDQYARMLLAERDLLALPVLDGA